MFAYGYGTLAELQYKYVGQDQLIGGTWSVPQTRSFPLVPLAISLLSLFPPLSLPRYGGTWSVFDSLVPSASISLPLSLVP